MKAKINKVTIHLTQDDILSLPVQAVVNSTDPNLSLSPRLLERGGVALLAACSHVGWCDVGAAVATTSGDLPFMRIIHAVGPRWGEGSERGKLANVTQACLHIAEHERLRSLAMPAIATGALGYPLENCAKTMLTQIINFILDGPRHIKLVVVCVEDMAAYRVFASELSSQLDFLKAAGEDGIAV
ncbi:MAG: macro domain-containing protein [Anaerolineae bacterium]|nr:macro domain-containing protein [Anaerolineae bacterium]